MNLSPHFTLEEMTASKTADANKIDNTPTSEHVQALALLCVNVLEPLRMHIARPIKVTSGYRCPALNKLVGGAKQSQHQRGEAVDIQVKGVTVGQLFDAILKSGIPFDQIIQEFDEWVHVSFSAKRQRRSVLYAYRDFTGKVCYTKTRDKFMVRKSIAQRRQSMQPA